MSDDDRGWPKEVPTLFAALAILLVVFQYEGMPVLVKSIGMVFYSPFDYLDFAWLPIHGILFSAILILFLAVPVWELRTGRISLFFSLLFRRERLTLAVLFATCLVAVRFYFSGGETTLDGDAAHHAMHTRVAMEGIRAGALLVWTPLLSVGSSFVQFYGFVYAYLSGISAYLFGFETGQKLLLGLLHALSGVTCYLYVSRLTGRRDCGFIAGLAFVLTFWHTQLVLVMGRYPAALVFALLPLPFLAVEALRTSPKRPRWVLAGGVSTALLICSHPGYGFWTMVLLVLYTAVRYIDEGTRLPTREVAATLGLGFGLSAFLTIPMLAEQEWTGLPGFSMETQPLPTLGHLLVWWNYRYRLWPLTPDHVHWFGGYVGLSLVALALLGAAISIGKSRVRTPAFALSVALCVSLFFSFGGGRLFGDFAPLRGMGASRFLVFGVFFLSAMAGVGWSELQKLIRVRSAYVVVLTVLLADLGATTFIFPYDIRPDVKSSEPKPEWLAQRLEAVDAVDEGRFVSQGLLYAGKRENTYFTLATGSVSPFGLFEEHPRADRRFVRPFYEAIDQGMKEIGETFWRGQRSLTPTHGLRLLNVTDYLWGTKAVSIHRVSPVTVSNSIDHWEEPQDSRENAFALVAAMALDPGAYRCGRILTRDASRVGSLPGTPVLEFLDHRTWVDRSEIDFRVSGPAFCRVAFGYYPWLNVTLDGESVDFFETADGFVGLKLPAAGTYRLGISAELTPLRQGLLVLGMILFVAACVWVRRSEA